MVFHQEGGIHAASGESHCESLGAAKRDPVSVARPRDVVSPGMANTAAASGEGAGSWRALPAEPLQFLAGKG